MGRLPWVAESLKEAPSLAPMLVKEWLGAIGPFPAVPTLLSQSVSLLSPSPTAGPMSTLLLAGHPPPLWEAPPWWVTFLCLGLS